MSESEQAIYLFLDKNPFSRLSDLWRIFPDMPKGTLALCFSKWMDKMRAQQQRQLKEILANQDEPLSNPLNRHLEKEDLPSGDSLNSATTTKSAESLKSKQAGTPIQTRKSETDSIEADQAENTNKTLDNAKKQLRDNSDQDNSSSRIPKANLPPAVAKNKPFFYFC
ncbi:MAG: hypothetical protein OEY59_01070 [Deltaproteobacteria bacterium]|nr:hypothetical protein [Deltaproteobacteria bacterium]